MVEPTKNPDPENLDDAELDRLIREATTALARVEAAAFANHRKRGGRVRPRHRDPARALIAGLPRPIREAIEEGPREPTLAEQIEHLQQLSLQLRRGIKKL